MYERIVVALDGSELAEKVLPHVTALAEAFRPSVTLVRAYEPPRTLMAGMAASALPGTGPLMDPGPAIRAGRDEADDYLEGIGARLSAAGVPAEPVRVDGGAASAILAVARERHATLIAMTTHGRGGLTRLVFGSVAEAVLRHAPCPVLLVRADDGSRHATEDVAEPHHATVRSERAEQSLLGEPARLVGGTRLMRYRVAVSALNWVVATPERPCPVCGATDACCVADGSGYARCRAVCSVHPVEGGGWLHDLRGAPPLAAAQERLLVGAP
jgi:nucleotide-binding universal stress UspA family protein